MVLGLLEGGQAWPWASWQTVAAFGSALLLIAGFVLVERRAPQPVLPLWVFTRRAMVVPCSLGFLVGGLLLGLSSYVPTLGQEVVGASAVVSGFALAALTLGWPVAASVAGRLYLSIGFRATGLLGVSLAIAGAVVLVVSPPPSRSGTSPRAAC